MKLRRRDTSRVVKYVAYSPNVDMGDLCDAVEWDWPRWGRRLVVSGPWPGTQEQAWWRVRIGKHSAILREIHRG